MLIVQRRCGGADEGGNREGCQWGDIDKGRGTEEGRRRRVSDTGVLTGATDARALLGAVLTEALPDTDYHSLW